MQTPDPYVSENGDQAGRIRLLEPLCSVLGHRWTPWERPLRLVETCRCGRCGRTRRRIVALPLLACQRSR